MTEMQGPPPALREAISRSARVTDSELDTRPMSGLRRGIRAKFPDPDGVSHFVRRALGVHLDEIPGEANSAIERALKLAIATQQLGDVSWELAWEFPQDDAFVRIAADLGKPKRTTIEYGDRLTRDEYRDLSQILAELPAKSLVKLAESVAPGTSLSVNDDREIHAGTIVRWAEKNQRLTKLLEHAIPQLEDAASTVKLKDELLKRGIR